MAPTENSEMLSQIREFDPGCLKSYNPNIKRNKRESQYKTPPSGRIAVRKVDEGMDFLTDIKTFDIKTLNKRNTQPRRKIEQLGEECVFEYLVSRVGSVLASDSDSESEKH